MEPIERVTPPAAERVIARTPRSSTKSVKLTSCPQTRQRARDSSRPEPSRDTPPLIVRTERTVVCVATYRG